MPHRPDADTADDLLKPSFADRAPSAPAAERPWRLSSQGYVAFFGGVLAVTTIAFINARRLGLAAGPLALILLAGFGGLAAEIAVLSTMADATDSQIRMVARIVAFGAWGGMYLLQRAADRRYHHFRSGDDDEYAGLLGPGLLASIGLGLVELQLVTTALDWA